MDSLIFLSFFGKSRTEKVACISSIFNSPGFMQSTYTWIEKVFTKVVLCESHKGIDQLGLSLMSEIVQHLNIIYSSYFSFGYLFN